MTKRMTLVAAVILFSCSALRAAEQEPQNNPPAKYDAVTDLDIKPLPPLPKLGPAGFVFKDPTFGTRILRVTDETAYLGHACVTPSASEHNSFNADSTMFLAKAEGGRVLLYRLDKTAFTCQRLMDPRDPKQPLALPEMTSEPCFSYTDPNILYGSSSKGHKILEYDLATHSYRELLDLDRLLGKDAVRVGMVSPSRNGILAINCGGRTQDQDPLEITFDTRTKTSHVLNTAESTLDGKPLPSKLGQTLHNSHIDLSGRYVLCTLANGTGPLKALVWDTAAADVYPANIFSDHRANGFGTALSNAGLAKLTREGLKDTKPFNTAIRNTAIIQGLDRHWSWNNQREGALLPAFVSNFAQAGKPPLNKVLLDEIDAASTDGSNVVYRFAHHRSTYRGGFWDSPRGNVSLDGRYFMFTSNWEESVGKNRQDVFIVELTRNPTATTTPK